MLVVGAGVAGVSAALTAARSGCSVALLEKENILGGTAVSGGVGAICGLFMNGGAEPGELLNPGITTEIVAGLLAASPGRKVKKVGKVHILPYAPLELEQLLSSLCLAEENLSLHLGAMPLNASVSNGIITRVTAISTGAAVVFAPRVTVDCSGNGELAFLAGAGFGIAPADTLQLAGYIAKVSGLAASDESLALKVPFLLARGVAAQALPPLVRWTVFSPGERAGEGFLKINIPDSPENRRRNLDPEAGQILAYLCRQLPEFCHARIETTSTHPFSREGRRINGAYTLTPEDLLSGRKFKGGVVRGAWPLEIWNHDKGVTYRYPPDGDYYEIPAGCLQANGFANLFVAGRCISVSHEALGSTRVIGCCLALGEQAALAAAAQVKSFTKGDC